MFKKRYPYDSTHGSFASPCSLLKADKEQSVIMDFIACGALNKMLPRCVLLNKNYGNNEMFVA